MHSAPHSETLCPLRSSAGARGACGWPPRPGPGRRPLRCGGKARRSKPCHRRPRGDGRPQIWRRSSLGRRIVVGITGAHLGESLAFKAAPAELCGRPQAGNLVCQKRAATRLAVSKAPPWANLGGAILYPTCFRFSICRTAARSKIEFSFLNCNLMVPTAGPHTFCW
jgi:hypothetical protein